MPRIRTIVLVLGALLAVSSVPTLYSETIPRVVRVTSRVGSYSQPAISGTTVVWFDGRRAGRPGHIPGVDIYGRNLRTGREFRVTSRPTADPSGSLMISGQTVLWDDCRHCRRAGGLPGYSGDELYMANIVTGRQFPLPLRAYGQFGPWLLSGVAVWGMQGKYGPVRFFAANSTDGRPGPLAGNRAIRTILARRGHLAVWRDGYDLRAADLLSGRTYALVRHVDGGGAVDRSGCRRSTDNLDAMART